MGTFPWSVGYFSSTKGPVKRRVRRKPLKHKAQHSAPHTQNGGGYENTGKITKARGGEAGSGKTSGGRKCPSPIFSCRGSIWCKIEVHGLINPMSLDEMCNVPARWQMSWCCLSSRCAFSPFTRQGCARSGQRHFPLRSLPPRGSNVA